MSDLDPVRLSLRRIAPLVAVLVLAGPAAAYAASPAPDAAPNVAVLAPDPIPTKPRSVQAAPRPVVKHSAPAPAPRRFVEVVRTTTHTVTAPPGREPRRQPPKNVVKQPRKARHVSLVPIVDVVPLRVDLHRGLGAISSNVQDNRRLALAAVAILAAALAAASGAALTAVARRPV